MDAEAREALIQKIRKLLKKADLNSNPFAAEAYAAAAKARELLAQYGLTEADLETEEEEAIIVRLDLGPLGRERWVAILLHVVAKALRAQAYYDTGTQTLKLIALPTDARVALEVFYFALGSAWELWARYYTQNPDARGARQEDYMRGFAQGLFEAFQAQEREHQEWGLVLRTPAKVVEVARSLNLVSRGATVRIKDVDAYNQGVADGRERGSAPRRGIKQ